MDPQQDYSFLEDFEEIPPCWFIRHPELSGIISKTFIIIQKFDLLDPEQKRLTYSFKSIY
jgi:hypothetical protein